MYLENIHITNFRNYDSCKISCSPKVNCLTGLNGMGKTSILEAIYYLCMGKSHSNALDVQIVKEGLDFFSIGIIADIGQEGIFQSNIQRAVKIFFSNFVD